MLPSEEKPLLNFPKLDDPETEFLLSIVGGEDSKEYYSCLLLIVMVDEFI